MNRLTRLPSSLPPYSISRSSFVRAASTSSVPPPEGTSSTTQGRRKPRLFTQRLAQPPSSEYPNILEPNSALDTWKSGASPLDILTPSFDAPAPIKYFNNPPPFPKKQGTDKPDLKQRPVIPKWQEHRYLLVSKRVSHQTGKGKIMSSYYGVVVGNGRGMVGYGDGKGAMGLHKAYNRAQANLDTVEMFEGRTIWTDMKVKFGSTEVHLRPRPRGFGLMCNPYIHQVCKAAGIKDISAKVHGSRNPIPIIKATLMMLHSGGEPLGLGDGIGGPGKREEKKQGIKSQATMERERGRAFIDGGAWI